jgi:hypothetical protein
LGVLNFRNNVSLFLLIFQKFLIWWHAQFLTEIIFYWNFVFNYIINQLFFHLHYLFYVHLKCNVIKNLIYFHFLWSACFLHIWKIKILFALYFWRLTVSKIFKHLQLLRWNSLKKINIQKIILNFQLLITNQSRFLYFRFIVLRTGLLA